jgi:hypothetical protein
VKLELRIPLPTPPGIGLLTRTAQAGWREGRETAGMLLEFARAIPSIAVSLQRLADLQDELAALGTLDIQLERLADLQDELATLGRLEGALTQIALFGTPLDKLTGPVENLAVAARTLPELSVAAQSLPELVTKVDGVEAIVAHMDARLDNLMPILERIAAFGESVEGDIDELGQALDPIGRLASRLPGARRRKNEA